MEVGDFNSGDVVESQLNFEKAGAVGMKVISERKAWVLGAWIGEYEQELNNTFRPGHKPGPFLFTNQSSHLPLRLHLYFEPPS
ncbi:hypothetical protein SRABI80_00383 [Peribacillus frigoritolerans]|nr:hypothetical protein SRABI80_00383 [Peribacillus frigoritolerans]